MKLAKSTKSIFRYTVSPSRWSEAIRVSALIFLFVGASCLSAQEDGTNEPRGLTSTKLEAEFLSESERLILQAIRDIDPQTALELATAVKNLTNVDLYDDARIYLGKIAALNLDAGQLYELNEAMGADFFLMLHTTAKLKPEGVQVAKAVLEASKNESLQPARIRQLITTLNDKDISVRSEAFRKLRRLGEPAVAEMLNTFADPEREKEFPGVRSGLKLMGANSQGPLLGAAYAEQVQVQAEAIRALGSYQSAEASDVLMRAYLSSKVPQYLRRIALDSITQGGKIAADPAVVEERLYRRSKEYLVGTRKYAGALLGSVKLWSWDPAAKAIVPADVSVETASRMLGSRLAEDLYEIRPDLARNRELYLLAQLEAAKRMAGPSKKIETEKIVLQLSTNVQELEPILEKAMKLELVPAAIACCEIMEWAGDESLLRSGTNRPSALVRAILFGDRYLQNAAFKAIAKIDPQQAYPGSSYMTSLAVYLAQSENRPAGLVGDKREELGQTVAAALAGSGIFGHAATSSREFFHVATSDPDIEILFVTDTMDWPQYAELIQQLRNDWRTRRMPVAFLYRDTERKKRVSQRIRNDNRFISVPISVKDDLVASNVERLIELQKPWRVSNIDRRRHAAGAVAWLTKIAADSANYPFYDLGAQQDSLARLLYVPGFAENGSAILARLGTPNAQRELVNFASQSGLPVEDRLKVAEAFARAVKQGGTLLTTKEIQQQYDRYNASRTESAESQKVLSTILDVIEARE